MRWRALTTARYWFAVAALAFGWCAGSGLAMLALVRPRTRGAYAACTPGTLHALIASPHDILTLPLRALIAAPFGLYDWGLLATICVASLVLVPCALLEHGTVRRVVSAPVIIAAALALAVCAWSFEVRVALVTDQLPALVCANR